MHGFFTHTLILCVALCLGAVAHAETSPPAPSLTFEPANFKAGRLALQNLIKYPRHLAKKKADLNVVIQCETIVKRTGKLKASICYNTDGDNWAFGNQIKLALPKTAFTPARVNGHVRAAHMHFYVLFRKQGQKTSVDVVPNNGLYLDTLGFDYTSAQRYRNNDSSFGTGCGIFVDLTVKLIVDTQGNPRDAIVEGENTNERCTKYIIEDFMGQKFIPAFHAGKAFESYYSERISPTHAR